MNRHILILQLVVRKKPDSKGDLCRNGNFGCKSTFFLHERVQLVRKEPKVLSLPGTVLRETSTKPWMVTTMKRFVSCFALFVAATIFASGCNKAAYQSAMATPEMPALIGNTDKLESQLSIARLQEHQGQLRDAADRYQQLAAKNPKNATMQFSKNPPGIMRGSRLR